MKCPKCGYTWFELTEDGEKALKELGYDEKQKEQERSDDNRQG